MTDPRLLLERLQKSLHILQQREAKYGLNAPASLILEIEDHGTAITLTEQLAAGHLTETAWREQLQPLLVKIEERQATNEVNNLNIGGVNSSHISHSTITVGNIDASVHIHTAGSAPPEPAALAAAEQRYRIALKTAFADDAAAYIPLAGETTEITTPNPQPKLSPRAAQRLRRRAGAEYAKLVGQGQEVKRIKLNTLREAVDQYDCIILLGAPGSGKTTSLENLAYQLADEPDCIPLPLRLSEFGPGQSLDDFIRWGWGGAASAGYWGEPLLASQAETYLVAGKLFILFDALNEMPGDRSSIRFYHQLLHEYFTARYIHKNNLYLDLMAHLITNDHWREVLLLTAGLISENNDFFRHFRMALDGLLTPKPDLIDLLHWVNHKSGSHTVSPESAARLKAYYIFLALNHISEFDLDFIFSFDSDRACEIACALTYALTRDHEVTLAHIHTLMCVRAGAHTTIHDIDLIRDFDINFDHACEIARGIARNLGSGAALDYLLATGLQSSLIIETLHEIRDIHTLSDSLVAYFGHVGKEAGHVSLELAAVLADLTMPDKSAPQATWQEFNRQLRRLMLIHRGLGHDWNLSKEQRSTLATYLEANQLLLECLDVASVDNPEAIKNSLLSPPGEWDF